MLGIKYRRTLEKGDILMANASIKIYELQDDNSLKLIDNVVKGDTIGFFTGSIVKFDGKSTQYVEFVTPDSTMGDGSPDFNRIPLYFDWDDAMNYVANPRFNYPDRASGKEQTSIVSEVTEWTSGNANKILWFIGILSMAALLVNGDTYFVKKRKRKPQVALVQSAGFYKPDTRKQKYKPQKAIKK